MASLNVQYRDFRYIVPFLVQFGLYVSLVGFSSNIVPERRLPLENFGHRRAGLLDRVCPIVESVRVASGIWHQVLSQN
jgi:ABC-type polysaccharide/polyol phosphate export permease